MVSVHIVELGVTVNSLELLSVQRKCSYGNFMPPTTTTFSQVFL